MQKNLKRMLACLLAVVMVLCAMPVSGDVFTAGAVSIPSDAVEFNGHYYMVYDLSLNWSSAKSYCEDLGGHMVTITSAEEQSFLINLTNSSSKRNMWIGAYPNNGIMEWITDEEFSYTNWASGEPNNVFNMQNAVMMYTYKASFPAGTWNDENGNGRNWSGYELSNFGFICEWEPKVFPDGYDFYEDSYSFGNYSESIGNEYYSTMYGNGKSLWLWKNTRNAGGQCFGMAYTTAALYNNLPKCDRIRDLSNSGNSFASISSVIKIGDKSLSVRDYIKYAYIYQFSTEARDSSVWTDGTTVYNMVKSYLDNNSIGVTIGMTRRDGKGGHRVLAVGIDGNDILIDDPNNTENWERITVDSDGSWSFSGLNDWNSDTCRIRYNLDYFRPYQILSSGNTVIINEVFTDDGEIDTYSYIEGMDIVDEDKTLLYVENDNCTIDNRDISEITVEDNATSDESNSKSKLYWLNSDNKATVVNTNDEKNTIALASNNTSISVSSDGKYEVMLEVDDCSKSNIQIVAEKGKEYTISFDTFDINDKMIDMTVSGIVDDAVTATQTETGLVVTGISDGTVTLSKDDEVIETKTITNSVSDIEIIYDKNGESDDVSLNYEHSHEDADHDGNCDICGEIMESVKNCPHLCHKSGFLGFIWKIVNFFNRLFKINQYCECGIKHY